jgi:hypothetical protein
MTPAVPVSVTCCPDRPIRMPAPVPVLGATLPETTTTVSFCHLTTQVSTGETGTAKQNGGDGVGTTQNRGAPLGTENLTLEVPGLAAVGGGRERLTAAKERGA